MQSGKLKQLGLFAITWPIFVEQVARILPGTINTVMLSHLGDAVVAGVTVANQIVMFCIILFSFIGIGCSVVLTHCLGARDMAGAQRIAVAAIAVNFWMGLIVSLLICGFAGPMLRLLDLPPGLLQYAQPFLALMGGTLFLEAINIAFASLLRAHGHTRDAMHVTLGANVLNIGLNCLLIFGLFGFPKMGVLGAALSTVISRACATLVLAWMVQWRIGFHLRLDYLWRLSGDAVGRILHIGVPAAGENLSWWMSFMTITYLIGQMGEAALGVCAAETDVIHLGRVNVVTG